MNLRRAIGWNQSDHYTIGKNLSIHRTEYKKTKTSRDFSLKESMDIVLLNSPFSSRADFSGSISKIYSLYPMLLA